MKYILSFSGGKDSTFLLLELIRRKYPLDAVQFFDTGWEFPVMYEHIDKCKQICEEHGIEFERLLPKHPFDDLFKKYSWCGGCARWGTAYKQLALDENVKKQSDCVVYIGIAADEQRRLQKEFADYKKFPLVEWGITEAQCLEGCYAAGFDWGGMYEHLDRLSCKYCRNKNLKELRNIRKYYPDVWEELKNYQEKTDRPYKQNMTVLELEKRFAFEDERIAAGLSINSKEFFAELTQRMETGG